MPWQYFLDKTLTTRREFIKNEFSIFRYKNVIMRRQNHIMIQKRNCNSYNKKINPILGASSLDSGSLSSRYPHPIYDRFVALVVCSDHHFERIITTRP